jgi:rfaE bifunctional protein kinase chain/domain
VTRERLDDILKQIRNTTVGVIGDYCLDAYWDLNDAGSELSLETGKPSHAVLAQRYSAGGAGNIASNCAALGCAAVHMFGVVGDDMFGRELSRILSGHAAFRGPLIVQPGAFQTPVYAKPYRGSTEDGRIDFGRFNEITSDAEAAVLASLRREIQHLGALIINQQLVHGICTPRVIAELNLLAQQFPAKIFLFDARNLSHLFHNMIRKLNLKEALQLHVNAPQGDLDSAGLKECAGEIERSTHRPVFITRGELGIIAFEKGTIYDVPAVRAAGRIVDTVGAGDTTVAALAASLAAGATVEEAAILGTLAAGVTVLKLRQTGTSTPEEILRSFSKWSERQA